MPGRENKWNPPARPLQWDKPVRKRDLVLVPPPTTSYYSLIERKVDLEIKIAKRMRQLGIKGAEVRKATGAVVSVTLVGRQKPGTQVVKATMPTNAILDQLRALSSAKNRVERELAERKWGA